jgi:hypothetical protein
MGNLDAEEKFVEAVEAFTIVDDKARASGWRNIDVRAFRSVMIDLDAAIPGLTDENLGRAKLLRAMCCYWLYLNNLPRVFDVDAPPDPLLQEGLSYALEGRKILEECGGSEGDLHWANDIVSKLSGE